MQNSTPGYKDQTDAGQALFTEGSEQIGDKYSFRFGGGPKLVMFNSEDNSSESLSGLSGDEGTKVTVDSQNTIIGTAATVAPLLAVPQGSGWLKRSHGISEWWSGQICTFSYR